MPRGGWRESARGKVGRPRTIWRPTLPYKVKARMELVAWSRHGRPTTDEETAAALAALIEEEARRVMKAPPDAD